MCSVSEPRSSNNDTSKIIWFRLPYAGHIGESIVNRLVGKLKRCFKEPVCFKTFYQTKKLSSFCSNKDPNPMYLKSHVIYKLTCFACNAEYIGKTDRCLRVRVDEYSSDHNSAIFQHLHSCEAFKFCFLWIICLVVLTTKPMWLISLLTFARLFWITQQLLHATITIINYVFWDLY